MDWVKNNVFYVVLVGVTAVLIGLILFAERGFSAEIEQAVKKRGRLGSRLRRFARGQEYNRDVINARRQEVDGSKQNLQAVIERSLEYNNRYEVLSLVRPDGKGTVDAFPFNRRLDREITLRAVFPDAYHKALKGIEASLNPTTAPAGEIPDVELRQWQLRVLQEARRKWAKEVQAGRIPATREENGQIVSTEPKPDQEMAQIARQRAIRSRMVEHARKGQLYLDPLALQSLLDPTERRPLLTTMWYAQLSLWLQRDIAEAIRKTNAEAFEGLPPKQHTVPHAAIKRLVEIRMIPQYVGGSGAGGPMGDDDGTTAGRLEASSLTGAVSNKDYDVLHYTMTVVLPFRYLGRFQWHLSKENYHTILDVQEVAAPEDRPNTYFYGSEPVVRVVMRGEWKLITEWERPLMPREVLNTLPRGALRDEDMDRPHTPGGQSNLTGDTTGAGRRRGLRGRR